MDACTPEASWPEGTAIFGSSGSHRVGFSAVTASSPPHRSALPVDRVGDRSILRDAPAADRGASIVVTQGRLEPGLTLEVVRIRRDGNVPAS